MDAEGPPRPKRPISQCSPRPFRALVAERRQHMARGLASVAGKPILSHPFACVNVCHLTVHTNSLSQFPYLLGGA